VRLATIRLSHPRVRSFCIRSPRFQILLIKWLHSCLPLDRLHYRSRPAVSISSLPGIVVICVQRMREGREESTEHVTLRRYMTIRYDTGFEHRPFNADASHYVFSATSQKEKTAIPWSQQPPKLAPAQSCLMSRETNRPSTCNEGNPPNVHRTIYF